VAGGINHGISGNRKLRKTAWTRRKKRDGGDGLQQAQ
jgi:hypothetical protein